LVAVLKWVPEWLSSDGLNAKDRAEDVGRTRTALLALVAGLIAVMGAIFTGLTYRLSRAGQITERFTRAVDQLGSATLDVRLGGIYALERIARDSKDDQPQVVEVLTAYVREHAPWPPVEVRVQAPDVSQTRAPRPTTDVHAAVTVLGRRKRTHDGGWTRLNLVQTDLRGLTLLPDPNAAHFELADLTGAHLEGADIPWPHFEQATFADAHLENAKFEIVPYFRSADLRGAHLEDADITSGKFHGAGLRGAHLERAKLALASFEHADLTGAHFDNADLVGTRFENATLWGAHFEGARLDRASLEGASYDRHTRWPDGFDPGAAGARLADGDEPPFSVWAP
jgi:uncharacterized protein YjbI with pentapeptide repeats